MVFTIVADDPPHSTITLTRNQVNSLKLTAFNAFQLAFKGYNANIGQGQNLATNSVYIVGQSKGTCGATPPLFTTFSRVYYLDNMTESQYAINITTSSPTADQIQTLTAAIGEGIGNNAAHEIGHQLVNRFAASGKVIQGMDMDDSSVGTYNGGSCSDPAVFTGTGADGKVIHWGPDAATSLTNILGKTQ